MEALGSRRNDYRSSQRCIKLRRNSTRDLKTFSSRRLNPISLATDYAQSFISDFYGKTPEGRSANEKTAIFANQPTRKKLLPVDDIAQLSITALKQVTGEPIIVLHSLRHLFCTRIQCHLYSKLLLTNQGRQIATKLALEESSISQFNSIHLEPSRYPFWNFRIGRWMGHEDEKTGLLVYSHATWHIVSGLCHRNSNSEPMTAGMAAALLGCSNRSMSTWLKNAPYENTSFEAMNFVIENHVQKGKLIPAINAKLGITNVQVKVKSAKSKPISMHMIDSFLCLHREGLRSLESLPQVVHQTLNIPLNIAICWKDSYVDVVRKSGLIDFENPQKQETYWKKLGVETGQVKRRYFLEKCQLQCLGMDDLQLSNLDAQLSEWLSLIEPKKPYIVCINIKGLQSLIQWIESIGYVKDDFIIHGFNNSSSDDQWIYSRGINIIPSEKRLSKTELVDGSSSFGLEVCWNESLPDGRDLLRSLLALSIGVRTFSAMKKGKSAYITSSIR